MGHVVRTEPSAGIGVQVGEMDKEVNWEAGKQAGAAPWRPWSHAAELDLHSAINRSHLTFCKEKNINNTGAG